MIVGDDVPAVRPRDQDRPLETGLLDHCRQVVRPKPAVGVVLRARGLLRQTVAANVEGDDPMPGWRDRRSPASSSRGRTATGRGRTGARAHRDRPTPARAASTPRRPGSRASRPARRAERPFLERDWFHLVLQVGRTAIPRDRTRDAIPDIGATTQLRRPRRGGLHAAQASSARTAAATAREKRAAAAARAAFPETPSFA